MIRFEGDTALKCLEVLRTLEGAGYDAYIVGGAVRDYLLGLPVSDFDIASSASPDEVMELFNKVIPTGVEHGTVTVIYKEEPFEVTTFRSEKKYDDFRHPSEVTFLKNIEEDLARRDFTINSMALSESGQVIDPFSGRDDLKSGLIRTVGVPDERFTEDPLRMLRALRFLSVLSFSFDDDTFLSIKNNAHLLSHIAVERITSEFNKLLAGKAVNRALKKIVETDVCSYLPGMSQLHSFLEDEINVALLETDEERWTWLASQQEDSSLFLKDWRHPNRLIKRVDRYLSLIEDVKKEGWTNETVYYAFPHAKGCERVLAVLQNRTPTYKDIDRIASALPITSSDMLAVTGKDLIAWTDSKPGPWVGEYLERIERAILNEGLKNEKSSIKRWLENWQTQ